MGASSPQKLSKGKQQQTNQYQNLRVDFDIELFTLAFFLFVRGFLSLFVQPLFFFSLLCPSRATFLACKMGSLSAHSAARVHCF